jgi:acyl-CoA synthetase (AMP-forming)/AMP-acid ligase II/acetyltransferase-like isoleucine patch superfamily enzyme/acyl carrier protein
VKSFREYLCGDRAVHSDSPFLTLVSPTGERTFSREELLRRTEDYCEFYRERRLLKGDAILVVLRESLDLFASFFAGIASGFWPAFCAYPSPKQSVQTFLQTAEHLLNCNRIKLLVGFGEVVDLLQQRRQTEGLSCAFKPSDVRSRDSSAPFEWPSADEQKFLQFSSGTTGARKGVLISIEALENQSQAYAPLLEYDRSSKVVSWLPHYHDMGLIACMLIPFMLRVPIIMMSPFEWVRNPKMLLEAITRHRATHLWMPNFALGHLAKSIADQEVSSFDLGTVRRLVCCSEPALAQTVERFVDKFQGAGLSPNALQNCYAMAENTFAMTSTGVGPFGFLEVEAASLKPGGQLHLLAGGKKIASAGRPLHNVQIRILGESGDEVPENSVGEIAILSDCMLAEYHCNPEATKAAFAGEWFKTGDLGFLHGGELYVVGRKKDIIIVAGENIWPEDVETILNEDDQLIAGRNVVFGVEDEALGSERVVILAETHRDVASVDTLALQTRIVDALNIAVSDIAILPHMTLRKSTAGKISRQLNKAAYLSGSYRKRADVTSDSGLIRLVKELVPNFHGVGLTDQSRLITSGLIDSFAFVELISKLEEQYGVRIPQRLLTAERFDTVAQIEQTLTRLREDGEYPAAIDLSLAATARAQSRTRLIAGRRSGLPPRRRIEMVINNFPIAHSWIYRLLMRLAGIQIGRNVTFLGRVHLKLRGSPKNLVIEDEVILGQEVDLRNRENGRILIRSGVYIDNRVRIVAARDGSVELGTGTEVGAGTVINSGGVTQFGEFCMLGGNVNINSSSHGIARDQYVKEQPHSHGRVILGDDVWVGAGATILINTTVGTGAVIGANSVVSGEIPPLAICAGIPAKVLKYR